MPIYEFECLKCGHQFERLQRLSDPPVTTCPECGARKVSQLLSAPAIQFKGTGWYVTDYAKKSSAEASSGVSSNGKNGTGGAKSNEKSISSSDAKPAGEKDSKKTG